MIDPRPLAGRDDAGRSAPDRAAAVDAWLAAFWRTDCPPEPDSCPDALSVLGPRLGGGTVRWYEADDELLGYLPGSSPRCFWVPLSAVDPCLADALADDGPPCGGDDHDYAGCLPAPWLEAGLGADGR